MDNPPGPGKHSSRDHFKRYPQLLNPPQGNAALHTMLNIDPNAPQGTGNQEAIAEQAAAGQEAIQEQAIEEAATEGTGALVD